jgi:hypothetical protein
MSTEPTSPGPASWREWEDVLVTALRALSEGESVTVEAPARAARLARLPRRRVPLLPPKRAMTAPWVRLTRMEDILRGQCVGADVFGGGFPWTAEEHAALLTLGWHPSLADGEDYVRFWPDDVPQGPYLPREDAERAAEVVARTVREVFDPEGEETGESAGSDLPAIRH